MVTWQQRWRQVVLSRAVQLPRAVQFFVSTGNCQCCSDKVLETAFHKPRIAKTIYFSYLVGKDTKTSDPFMNPTDYGLPLFIFKSHVHGLLCSRNSTEYVHFTRYRHCVNARLLFVMNPAMHSEAPWRCHGNHVIYEKPLFGRLLYKGPLSL